MCIVFATASKLWCNRFHNLNKSIYIYFAFIQCFIKQFWSTQSVEVPLLFIVQRFISLIINRMWFFSTNSNAQLFRVYIWSSDGNFQFLKQKLGKLKLFSIGIRILLFRITWTQNIILYWKNVIIIYKAQNKEEFYYFTYIQKQNPFFSPKVSNCKNK